MELQTGRKCGEVERNLEKPAVSRAVARALFFFFFFHHFFLGLAPGNRRDRAPPPYLTVRTGVQSGEVTRLTARVVIANGVCFSEKPPATAVRWRQESSETTSHRHPATGLLSHLSRFGDRRPRFISRDHHGPTAGFSVPEVSTVAQLIGDAANARHRAVPASSRSPEKKPRSLSRAARPFVYS